jgi:hypothetical protein
MARANSGARSGSRTKPARSTSKDGGSRSKPARKRSGHARRATRSKSSNGNKRAKQDLPDYSIMDPEEIHEAVDVYVDAPVVNIDEIKFELDDLRVHLAVLAEAGHFVQIHAGAAARLGKVELDIQKVETQALLEARLDNVTAILARVLTTLDRNPELLKSVGKALGDVGAGAHDLLTDTGDTIRSAGKGAASAVEDVGQGAGKGVAGLGQGAEQGVEGLGQGAQQGVEGLGQGAQQGVQGLGQGAGQGVEGVGQGAQQGLENLAQGGQQGGTPQKG